MCVFNNAFELQALNMSEIIQKNSIYQPFRIVYTGGKSVGLQDHSPQQMNLITSIVLKDEEGNLYEIEPCENGLRFAKGEIRYSEYLRLQKKESRQVITYFSLITGAFFIMGWTLVKFFI